MIDYPLWVKQAIFRRLYQDLVANYCEKLVLNTPEKIFGLYEPTITFDGENELKNKTLKLDNNIYNFLKLCRANYNLLEISLNTFLSIEETAKIFIFCIDQNYVEKPEDKDIYALTGFLSGKFRTGEYFKEKGIISEDKLNEILEIRNTNNKPIGEILSDLDLVNQEDIKTLFTLKYDAKKRFILDSSIYPESELQASEKERYQIEIDTLKKETEKLKIRMRQLLQLVTNSKAE